MGPELCSSAMLRDRENVKMVVRRKIGYIRNIYKPSPGGWEYGILHFINSFELKLWQNLNLGLKRKNKWVPGPGNSAKSSKWRGLRFWFSGGSAACAELLNYGMRSDKISSWSRDGAPNSGWWGDPIHFSSAKPHVVVRTEFNLFFTIGFSLMIGNCYCGP